jgi:nucleotide-binding universal stress UspA family protein
VSPSPPRTIVVGYDGSESSRQAVAEAAALAGGEGGRIVVVHARDHAAPVTTSRWRELLEAEHEAEGRAILDAILLEGSDELADTDWETRLAAGRPAEALVQVAREVGADLIVVGSHGYGPVSSLLGSVSHELLRISDRPVTVLPPGCLARSASGRRPS